MKKILLSVVMLLGIILQSQAQGLRFNKWEIYETKDDFGDPSGDKLLVYYADSESGAFFSNSTTFDGELMAGFMVDKRADEEIVVGISLIEYETSPVTAYTETKYRVKIKDDLGKIHSSILIMPVNTSFMFTTVDDTIYDLLRTNQKLKFYIEEMSDRHTSTYNFEVETDNFIKLFESVFGK